MPSAISDASIILGGMEDPPEWHGIPKAQAEVLIELSSINSDLDPIIFADAVHNENSPWKFNMSIGSTSTIWPYQEDDL